MNGEKAYHTKVMSLYFIIEHRIDPLTANSRPGDIVHVSTNVYPESASCMDNEFNVMVKGAINMKRHTEYCQWSQSQVESCETCTREVKAKDGSKLSETYDCNCVIQYFYTKSWRPYLINSLMFDQPAAHHNPMRDPYPSQSITANEANFSHDGRTINIPSSFLQNTRASYHNVQWTPSGAPPSSFFSRFSNMFFTDTTRYRPLTDLRGTDISDAALHHQFVYIGQGGYFFSPYKSSLAQNLFQYFMQYIEGTLLDWQIGDLIQSCTPGDIRVSYQVQDPKHISILAAVGNVEPSNVQLSLISVTNGISSSGTNGRVGFIHEGDKSVEEIIQTEQYDSFYQAAIVRGLLLLWSIPISRLMGSFFGKNLSKSTFITQVSCTLSIWCSCLAFVWMFYWGLSETANELRNISNSDKQIVIMFTASVLFGSITMKYAQSKLGVYSLKSRLNAVWCILGQWSGAPPEWRVEESYNVAK